MPKYLITGKYTPGGGEGVWVSRARVNGKGWGDPTTLTRPHEASRPPFLVVALQVLGGLALPAPDRAAGDGRPLAPHRLA